VLNTLNEFYNFFGTLSSKLLNMKILIIEDHPKIRENIKKMCELEKITTDTAIHGAEWITRVKNTAYDCVILDMNMPVMNGKEFLIELRKLDKHIPVLVLTSNSMLWDKLEAFDIWADDYLTKPFESAELIARVKALTRRQRTVIIEEIRVRDVNIDLTHAKVYQRGKEVELWAKEYKIIAYLATSRWITRSKDDILQAVWGEREELLPFDSTTLEAHISMIRRKLWKDLIKTYRNVGYVME